MEEEEGEEEVTYVKSRAASLGQQVPLGNETAGGMSGSKPVKPVVPRLKLKRPQVVSKFDRYLDDIQRGKFLSLTHSRGTNGKRERGGGGGGGGGEEGGGGGGDDEGTAASNETKELFSNSEGEENVEEGEGGREESGEEGSPSPHIPSPVSSTTPLHKNSNPFKVSVI